MTLRDEIRTVVAQTNDEWDEEGDHWLLRPNPDTALLEVDALTDALARRLAPVLGLDQ